MRLNRLISFLTGYVIVLIRGPHLEKMINLLTTSGLYVWDIRRLEAETLEAKIRAHGFLRIRDLINRTGTIRYREKRPVRQFHIKIQAKKGWPFLWRNLKQRKIFFIGAIVFVTMLIYLSSFVLFIKVDGFEGAERIELLHSLARKGLRTGVLRQELLKHKNTIEREVMIDTPNAVWLGITLKGIVAEVKVIKRKNAPQNQQICDIVAERDGVVARLITIRGMPVVKEGDSVARGDLLISGTIWHSDPQNNDLGYEEVPANGIVEARVWYDLSVLEPKIIWRVIYGKSSYTEYKLRWGRNLWTIIRFGAKKKGNYSLIRRYKRIFQGRNPQAVVELIKDSCQEVLWRRTQLTDTMVKAAALVQMNQLIKNLHFPKEVSQHTSWTNEGQFIKLTITLETKQDIATVKRRTPTPLKGAL